VSEDDATEEAQQLLEKVKNMAEEDLDDDESSSSSDSDEEDEDIITLKLKKSKDGFAVVDDNNVTITSK